jgi:transketolase
VDLRIDAATTSAWKPDGDCLNFRLGENGTVPLGTAAKPIPLPDVILIGTGSEVSLCVEAYEKLKAEGVKARVVSMPSWELFEAQPQSYRDAVLPPSVTRRVAVELGVKQGWERYIGPTGQFIGMCGFGASAPIGVLLKHFGFTVENVVAAAKK